jgi:hypothetical protein
MTPDYPKRAGQSIPKYLSLTPCSELEGKWDRRDKYGVPGIPHIRMMKIARIKT